MSSLTKLTINHKKLPDCVRGIYILNIGAKILSPLPEVKASFEVGLVNSGMRFPPMRHEVYSTPSLVGGSGSRL